MKPEPSTDVRAIWSFDCIGICSVLALSLDSKKLKQLCAKHMLLGEGAPFDATAAFYQLHKACHASNGAVALSVSHALDARFARTIRAVRELEVTESPAFSRRLRALAEEAPAAALWASLTDPRDAVHGFGVYESHRLVRCGLRRQQDDGTTRGSALPPAVQRMERDRDRAQSKAAAYAEKNRELQQAMDELGTEIEKLKATCAGLTERNQALEERPTVENQLRRTIRKLEYELQQAQTSPSLEAAASAATPWDAEPADVLEQPGGPGSTCGLDGTACRAPRGSCPLQALRVAVVGGLDRLRPQYRAVVEALGAEFVFHNGHCKAGGHPLKNVVCGSDLVVFITSINSHNALKVVKSTCRKEGKQFCVMRETSPNGLERRLLQAVSASSA